MLALTEERAKAWLGARGLHVPRGLVADDAQGVAHAVQVLGGSAVVKALVPAGRRGLAGAVRLVGNAAEGQACAQALLGTVIGGHHVRRFYVEERIDIAQELYLAFSLTGARVQCLVSLGGGVDIEEVMRTSPERILRIDVDPLEGMGAWQATELWLEAGLRGSLLPAVANLTAAAYESFRAADAELLEINPLAVDATGRVVVVGAMLGIDACALFRHPQWRDAAVGDALPENPRERVVALADVELPGGECRYVELDGDIGLLVGGGGAGLYQHDLVLELGGRPANHSVSPPTGTDNRKLKAVIGAILDNPRLRGLLVGFNFAQMARADIRVRTLIEVLDERARACEGLPIVIRLFGAGEEDARAMVAGRGNIHYVPRGTTLREAVRLIVDLTREAHARETA
jgi:succinyl-CoA synthetase beta subunit